MKKVIIFIVFCFFAISAKSQFTPPTLLAPTFSHLAVDRRSFPIGSKFTIELVSRDSLTFGYKILEFEYLDEDEIFDTYQCEDRKSVV
jgi:hypothetical protein